ncbi:MAG TPA: sulfatase [Thermoleophilaceae bacterium]|jgi:arylsulfatase A-like enzyme
MRPLLRSRLLRLALLVVGLAVGALLAGQDVTNRRATAGTRVQRRANVVVLMTDDETVEDMAVMPQTRALLGDEGVTFDHNYVSYPVCAPSRASFFSGQYAHNHRVMGLYEPTGGYIRFDRSNDLPVWLQDAGYVTAHIGKYMNGYGTEVKPTVPPGWTDWHGAIDGSTYKMWGYTLDENGRRHTYGSPFIEDPRLYQTDVYREKAVRFIRRRAPSDRPFFLSVAFLAPHHEAASVRARTGMFVRPAPRHRNTLDGLPFVSTRSFDEPNVSDKPAFLRRHPLGFDALDRIVERRRERQRSLLAVDDAVVAIVDQLRRSHELDDTYIVFTSDNGYMQGEHDVPTGKMLPYEPSTRVPLIVRGPGIPRGRTSHELVGNIDLAPTLVGIAHAHAGKPMDGRSLLPYARDPDLRSNRPFLHETGGRRFVPARDLDQDGTPRTRSVLSYRAVRTDHWLYIEYRGGARELYDLKRDPDELHSHHDDPRYAGVRHVLHRLLERLAKCRGASCRRAAPPVPAPRPPAIGRRTGPAAGQAPL